MYVISIHLKLASPVFSWVQFVTQVHKVVKPMEIETLNEFLNAKITIQQIIHQMGVLSPLQKSLP